MTELTCFAQVVPNIARRQKLAKQRAKADKANEKRKKAVEKKKEGAAARKNVAQYTKVARPQAVDESSQDAPEVAQDETNQYVGACVQCDNKEFPDGEFRCDAATCENIVCKNEECATPCQQRSSEEDVLPAKCDRMFCTKACELKHECPSQEK
jgi:hypothetical protein